MGPLKKKYLLQKYALKLPNKNTNLSNFIIQVGNFIWLGTRAALVLNSAITGTEYVSFQIFYKEIWIHFTKDISMPKTITVSINCILVSLSEFLKSYNTKYEMSILINSP